MRSKNVKGPSTEAQKKVAEALVQSWLKTSPTVEAAYERALGQLAVRHSLLHFFLEKFSWWAWDMKPHIGKLLTENLPTSKLIDKLRESVEIIVSDREDRKELDSLLKKIKTVGEKRNELLHSIWLISDSQPVSCMSRKRGILQPTPSVDDINSITNSTIQLLGEFLVLRDALILSRARAEMSTKVVGMAGKREPRVASSGRDGRT